MDVDRVLDDAVRVFGLDAQVDQTVEELAELIVALRHWRRGRAGALVEVAEEVADVEIMLAQLRGGFGGGFRAVVEAVKLQKLEGLDGRASVMALPTTAARSAPAALPE